MQELSISYNKKRLQLWFLIIVNLFIIIFSLESFINHYQFRTTTDSLGIFQHALYCAAHLHSDSNKLLTGSSVSSEKFSPFLFLFIPMYYLFGSYTLLLVQLIAVIAGGIGIYKYAQLKFPNTYIPVIVLFQFFGIWAIYSALSSGFHYNVAGAMLVPWFIYYYERKQTKPILLFFTLILMCTANMALWMVFIIIGLLIKNGFKEPRSYLRLEIPLLSLSILYLLFSSKYGLFQAESWLNPLLNSLSNPKRLFTLLFESQKEGNTYFGYKSEFHFMVLVSGGIVLLYRPWYLLMLIPIYVEKLLCNDPAQWSINLQYSIEFAPILSIALVDFLETFSVTKTKYIVAMLVTCLTHYFNISTMDNRVSDPYYTENEKYYAPEHYKTNLDVSAINNALSLIPSDASISASSILTPHLANHYQLYGFPYINNADYIAILTNGLYDTPESKQDYSKKIDSIRSANNYNIFYNKNYLLIMKRK